MMLDTTTEETYEDGQVIFTEGSSGDWVYLVEQGAVELSKEVDGQKMVVAIARPGEIFGELAFITNEARTATARAMGETIVAVMDRNVLDSEYNRMSENFRILMRSLARRLRETTDACVGLHPGRVHARIQKCLSLTFRSKEAFVKAYTHNVSAGGLFIKTEEPLEKDAIFDVDINVPEYENPLRFSCQVMWVRKQSDDPKARPPGMGVQFVKVEDKDKARLMQLLK